MRYLPILSELFSSDTVIFLLIGLAVFTAAGIMTAKTKKNVVGMVICLAVYAVCEILMNIRSSYLIEFILLFAGTVALGGALGFAIGAIVSKIRSK